MLDVIAHMERYPSLARASAALGGFYLIYRRLVEAYDTLPLDGFTQQILDITGYRAMLTAAGEEGETRLENIGQLVSAVKTYADQRGPEATLAGFLEEVALISDIDSYDEGADVVVMMTMHAAKGLEFDYVFLIGLEEGIFPSEMSRYSEEDLEEERRLCYVGITRAKKELYLSSAASRMLFGQTKRNRPSRFVEEIDPELVQHEQSAMAQRQSAAREAYMQRQNQYLDRGYNRGMSGGSGGFGGSAGAGHPRQTARGQAPGGSIRFGAGSSIQAGSAAAPRTAPAESAASAEYHPGDVVEHKVFGRGVVLKVTPVAGDHIVEIKFDTAGVKKTMANYAPLKRV